MKLWEKRIPAEELPVKPDTLFIKSHDHAICFI